VILDFGDGNSVNLGAISSAATAPHTYSTTGAKTARATQSGSGGSSSAVVVVQVN
jgi:hypothetical protein